MVYDEQTIAMRRSLQSLLLLGHLALYSTPATANVAAVRPDPAIVVAPAGDRDDGRPSALVDLQVIGERLTFDCSEAAARPVCDFHAVYRVKSNASERQAVVGAFVGVHTSEVQIQVEGRTVSHALTAAEVARIDAAVQADLGRTAPSSLSGALIGRPQTVGRVGFRMVIEPGQEVRVEAAGRARPGRRSARSFSGTAVETRHPLLGTRAAPLAYDLEYLVAPIRTWGRVGTILVTIHHPVSWKVGLTAVGPSGEPKQKSSVEGETRTVELTLNPATDLLTFHIVLPERVFHNGGVLLAIGGTVDDPRGVSARLGYEVAAPDWLFHGVTMDTDFSDTLVFTPTWEAATRGAWFLIPSLALGLGVPVQVAPEVTAGIRAQFTLQWPFVGLVTSIDVYPGLDGDDEGFYKATVLAQVAL